MHRSNVYVLLKIGFLLFYVTVNAVDNKKHKPVKATPITPNSNWISGILDQLYLDKSESESSSSHQQKRNHLNDEEENSENGSSKKVKLPEVDQNAQGTHHEDNVNTIKDSDTETQNIGSMDKESQNSSINQRMEITNVETQIKTENEGDTAEQNQVSNGTNGISPINSSEDGHPTLSQNQIMTDTNIDSTNIELGISTVSQEHPNNIGIPTVSDANISAENAMLATDPTLCQNNDDLEPPPPAAVVNIANSPYDVVQHIAGLGLKYHGIQWEVSDSILAKMDTAKILIQKIDEANTDQRSNWIKIKMKWMLFCMEQNSEGRKWLTRLLSEIINDELKAFAYKVVNVYDNKLKSIHQIIIYFYHLRFYHHLMKHLMDSVATMDKNELLLFDWLITFGWALRTKILDIPKKEGLPIEKLNELLKTY